MAKKATTAKGTKTVGKVAVATVKDGKVSKSSTKLSVNSDVALTEEALRKQLDVYKALLPFNEAALQEAITYYSNWYSDDLSKFASILYSYKESNEALWEMDMIAAIDESVVNDGLAELYAKIDGLNNMFDIVFDYGTELKTYEVKYDKDVTNEQVANKIAAYFERTNANLTDFSKPAQLIIRMLNK